MSSLLRKKWFRGSLLLLLVIASGWAVWHSTQLDRTEQVKVGPSLVLPMLDEGTSYSWENDFLGKKRKALILYFFTTYCQGCWDHLPLLQEIWETYRERGVDVLAVNLGESRNSVQVALQAEGIRLPVALDPEARMFSGTVPTAVLLDAKGEVSRQVGSLSKEVLQKKLSFVLAAP